ncbi:zinc ABC transporter substrate-binding protein [Paenibacillus sp. LHD-117]|uniref:metal ABC transporter solute-binding protein, Zn/Mn family n=1 Tax=Paenibacillus sp. LHD-117 TaxID=3071412 RepID=UPI0027DF41FB|nr:zinc ABC transporter substrate-binding protein [Paenibacillus sp. LHD-117]MDQ6419835.1 zinc ABC transporter substrate-binding protein [Paenibacillus sp. LHD-117]
MKRTSKVNSAVRRFVMTIIFLSLAALTLAACGGEQSGTTSGDGKLTITATTGMIADIAAVVGGDRVAVTGLMGPGIDPHLYKASQGDVKKLDGADIIFYNGLHLEGKMGEIFEKLEKGKPVVAVSKDIDESKLHGDPNAKGGATHDPHIWFNVQLWMSAVEVVRDTLKEQDAENADYYESRAADYLTELSELDGYAREQIALIPEKSRILVTAHDAFGYFGEAYGLKVLGLQGMNTMSEYGSKDVSELRDFLVDNGIKAVFIESSVSSKSIESVIEGAKKLGHEVVIGGQLFSDAMGDPGTVEGTYIGMVKHNVDTIVAALK